MENVNRQAMQCNATQLVQHLMPLWSNTKSGTTINPLVAQDRKKLQALRREKMGFLSPRAKQVMHIDFDS